jgi:hypothetical protein
VQDELQQSAVRKLLDEAIERLVADARQDGGLIRTGPEAGRLARTYPGSGLSPVEVAEVLVRAALAAGVATELSRPE